MENRERIQWADILKFIGMLLIYWGHLPVSSNVSLYIYAHHVPLFFFASGLFATMSPYKEGFGKYLLKKVRSLVLPYLFFSFLTLIYYLIIGDSTVAQIPEELLRILLGVRNNTLAVQLWFLPCLFLISIGFELLKRLLKNEKVIILVTCGIFLIGITCLGHEPTQNPLWVWNIDSAMVYILYYMIGAATMPALIRLEWVKISLKAKIIATASFAIATGLMIFLIIDGSNASGILNNIFPAWVFEIIAVVFAAFLIFFDICLAKLLGKIRGVSRFFSKIGEGSLYLNGNEKIFKSLFSLIFGALGIKNIIYGSDISMLLFSLGLIILLFFSVNILERRFLGKWFENRN